MDHRDHSWPLRELRFAWLHIVHNDASLNTYCTAISDEFIIMTTVKNNKQRLPGLFIYPRNVPYQSI